MSFKQLTMLAALAAALATAGCGGKKAMDKPADTGTTSPAVEDNTPKDIKAEDTDTGAKDISPVSVNDVFFEFDQYNLTAEAKGTLGSNANEMKRAMDASVTIEGHCDERGTKAYNIALGEKRANAARDYLIAMGVNGARITTISFGKERPFEMGHDESAWAKNRRAHFVVTK